MPKRQCPFDNDLMPQLKVHFGQKEYDLNHEEQMSKIHDKTLKMLFDGANKADTAAKATENENKSINKNVSEFCGICSELNVAECKCTFCDKWTCQCCSAICIKCFDVFCVAHSLKLYRRDESECVCLNCCVKSDRVMYN